MEVFAPQLAQHVVHELVYAVRDNSGAHIRLHIQQLIECDNSGRSGWALLRLLLFQNRQSRIAVLHILRHHLQLKPVIERLEDLLLRV